MKVVELVVLGLGSLDGFGVIVINDFNKLIFVCLCVCKLLLLGVELSRLNSKIGNIFLNF